MNDLRYEFGANWSEYIKNNFTEERLEISRNHLLKFLKLEDLNGMTFLDIGCGSGLHSLAAYRSGAERVISFDFDGDSVSTTRYLHKYVDSPSNWSIFQGSVLDLRLIQSIDKADIVYSWGVLHHTGDMWKALRNVTIPLKQGGILYIALYTTDVYIKPNTQFWLNVKRKYNLGNIFTKRMMECAYAIRTLIRPCIMQRKNPFTVMAEYKKSRGMSYWTDVRDWLGGWPMEFAGLQETKEFFRSELNMELINITAGEANTEYLFRRENTHNYWDEFFTSNEYVELSRPYTREGKYMWSINLPELKEISDTSEEPKKSLLMLYEDGVPSGFAHCPLHHIAEYGKSRYSHRGEKLYFSAIDNTDPNQNGRKYGYRLNT